MKLFWSIFFLGSMLIVGFDVRARRNAAEPALDPVVEPLVRASGDPFGFPTPRP